MKLSTYINSLNEIKGLIPEGIDPDITYSRSFMYGDCLSIRYSVNNEQHHIEVRPEENGLTKIETTVTERKD